MSHTVRVVCGPELAAGFELGGVEAVVAHTSAEGATRLLEVIEQRDVGIVLIQQNFYDDLADGVRRMLGRRPLPMVVPFPPPRARPAEQDVEAYLVEILRQAIGYRVRLR